MNIIVKPLDGIYWDGGNICIGASKECVEKTGINFDKHRNQYYCFHSELRIDFNHNNCVEFIEFIGGFKGITQPIIFDVLAFNMTQKELFETLSTHNNGVIDDTENGYSYSFRNLSVGLYCESTLECLAEFINEMKENGLYSDHSDKIKEEEGKASHWATMGIGCENYYDSLF